MKNNKSQPVKIVFWGTPEFARLVFEQLFSSPYKPSFVITAPDKPVGRKRTVTPPPVKCFAQKAGIEIFQSYDWNQLYERLKNMNPELFVVAAYGKIIPQRILDIPSRGALNVHPSLLPCWRGPSPIQSAILSGEKETGVTVMLMDAQMDHGPILAQERFAISKDDTFGTLAQKLGVMGGELLVKTVPSFLSGELKPREQNHGLATYSKIIKKEDGRIDWNESPEHIERMMRAFTPWPGVYAMWNGKRVKILSAKVGAAEKKQESLGRVFLSGGKIAVHAKGGIFIISILQLEGKARMKAEDFLRGYSEILSSTLQ